MADTLTEIPLDNDHEFIYRAKSRVAATGVSAGAVGVTGLTGFFSLTPDGDAITGTSTALVARATATSEYFGTLARVALNTALASLVNTRVYEILARDGYVETSEPVVVRLTRRPL